MGGPKQTGKLCKEFQALKCFCQQTYPRVCLVRRKSKQGSSMCICNSTYFPSAISHPKV